ASLQSEKDILRLERIALENRVKQLTASAASAPANPTPAPATAPAPIISKPEDAARIKQLEQERDELVKKLELANKQSSAPDAKAAEGVEKLQYQLAALRARIEVFEARRVPYTPEELALFKKPEPEIAASGTHPGKKSVRELPPGTARLVSEAERYFA